ncbi:globin-like protein [Stachybotrys elegans]|uniref:nitric oxide dioxygenase n=1 Tax=Stachybotrys elegans TaxID=80388 RepID=A0A8K0SS22_9HYPO|nr:globin-like protein [Stachybotrys elegans]
MALTQAQVKLVKATVPILKQHGNTITTTFYRNMLNTHPELKNVFSLRSQETGAQPAALAKSVLAYASHIDDLGKLGPAVEHIAMKHVSLFIRPEQYDIVGKHLVEAFGIVLGDALTPEIVDAWVAAYGQLANIFIQREKTLYAEMGDWQDWRKFEIVKKEAETDAITSFTLKPVDGKFIPSYLPGQYVSLQVPVRELNGLHQSRQFSLSEAPIANMNHYRVTVKKEAMEDASIEDLAAGKVPGLISNILHNRYNVGDVVELSPPHGDFFLDAKSLPETTPIVLLSAGVGATPVMSMLQTLLNANSSRPISWLHGARDSSNVCFKKDVQEAAAKHSNVRARFFVKTVEEADKADHVEGRLDVARLDQEETLHLDDASTQYFICGPEKWMHQTKNFLLGKGVTAERTHLELFETGGF